MNYTIIGYKDNGVDTCRGCVMSRWDSALNILTARGPHEASKHIAEFLYRNLTKDRYSDGEWEITVMFNGIPHDEIGERDTIMSHNPYYRIYRRAEKLATNRHEREVADKAAKEAAERVAKEEAERRKREQKELETYNRLRAKFETKE